MTHNGSVDEPQDSEQRRKRNAESQRRRRARLQEQHAPVGGRDFSAWFDLTTHVLQLELDCAWSSYLADEMDSDDANLRRLAEGKRHSPRLETTYAIGEALRRAGIPWCSGIYALYQHPKHFVEVFAVLDIIGADLTLFTETFDWIEAAHDSRLLDEAFATIHRTRSDDYIRRQSTLTVAARLETFEFVRELAARTTSLQSAIDSAWKRHIRFAAGDGKIHKVHNFFGGLYLIRTDPRFAPVARRFYEILDRERLTMLRPDQREKIERDHAAYEAARVKYAAAHQQALGNATK